MEQDARSSSPSQVIALQCFHVYMIFCDCCRRTRASFHATVAYGKLAVTAKNITASLMHKAMVREKRGLPITDEVSFSKLPWLPKSCGSRVGCHFAKLLIYDDLEAR